MSYELQGLCTGYDDPDLWFTDVPESIRDTGRLTIKEKQDTVAKAIVALSICNKCDVKAACFDEGMKPENIEHGIWGGTMSGERILLASISTNREDRKQRIAFAHRVRASQ
jgi:hypothetical protein